MMKKLSAAALLSLSMIVILAAPGAAAAEPSVAGTAAQNFAAVLQNPGHRKLVLQSAEATPAWTHLACATASFAPLQDVAVYLPVVFDKQGDPVRGEWRESFIASGCGAPVTLNVLTQITAPATLATGYLLPGSTIADPILQNAGEAFAVKAAGGIPAGCRQAFIANTAFAGYEGPAAAAQTGPWKEVWTLDLCAAPVQVVLHFAADGTGVTIDAAPAAAAR